MKSAIFALAAVLPLPAVAQSFDGFTTELQYQHYDDGLGFTVDSAEAYIDAAWNFGSIGAQIGLIYASEIDSSAVIDYRQFRAATLHLTSDLSDQFRLGAMIATNLDTNEIYLYAAEGLYLGGPLRLEVRLGDSLDDLFPFSVAEVSGTYDLNDTLKLRGGLVYNDYGPSGFYQVARLGLGYDVSENAEIYVDYARHRNDFGGASPTYEGSLWHVGLRFDLGGDKSDRLFRYHAWN